MLKAILNSNVQVTYTSTILEKWNGWWWRWYMLNDEPVAFVREFRVDD